MVEHAVEDNADAPSVAGIHELPENLLIAERRVDPEVVARVVLVIAPGGEDGIQVERVDAQRGDVVKAV